MVAAPAAQKGSTNGHHVNGHAHLNGNGHAHHSSRQYSVQEHPIGQRRKLRVVFIGAGASGMTFHYLARGLDYIDYQIYDKNSAIGGTWFENRYPGAGCDVPSFCYQFLFETSPDWSEFYAHQPEILAYFQRTAAKIEFEPKVKLNSRVSSCRWNESTGQWHVEVTHSETGEITHDVCDLLINGGGVLNSWKWPEIDGLHDFAGTLLHSANWDTSVDCAGKRVAVIGSGSSGIQIVPEMAKIASHVTAFNRSKSWILPGLCADLTPDKKGNNFRLPQSEIDRLSNDPEYLMSRRKYVEHELQGMFAGMMKDTPEQKDGQRLAKQLMAERLQHNDELLSRMVPEYHVGCKRPTPGQGYLESFSLPHVDLVTSPIVRITAKGIVTADGIEHEVDIIACATGFNTGFAPRYPVVGRDTSTTLADKWRDEPRAYLGLAEHGYPNMFHIYGPYSPVAHGSFFPGIDMYCRYILRVAERMSTDHIKSIEIKDKAVRDFIGHARAWLPRAAWSSACTNWYKRPNGTIVMWPGTMQHALHAFKETRYEHFDVEYRDDEESGCAGNSMAWLANGWTETERIPGAHLTGFLDEYIEATLKQKAPKVTQVDPAPPASTSLPV